MSNFFKQLESIEYCLFCNEKLDDHNTDDPILFITSFICNNKKCDEFDFHYSDNDYCFFIKQSNDKYMGRFIRAIDNKFYLIKSGAEVELDINSKEDLLKELYKIKENLIFE